MAGEEYCELTSFKKRDFTCEMDINDYERFQHWDFTSTLLNETGELFDQLSNYHYFMEAPVLIFRI